MRRRRMSAVWLAGFFALLIGAGTYFGFLNPLTGQINRGLDLAGGVHVVLQAKPTGDTPVTSEDVQTAAEVIRRRVDALGVAEPIIQHSSDRIIVDLAGVDPERALEVIGRTAQLEFKDPDNAVIVTGANLVKAQAAFDQVGRPVVMLEFDADGTKALADATRRLAPGREPLAMLLDGELIMDPPPQVSAVITDGRAQIEGIASIEEAQNIAVLLSSGALPVALEMIENRSVSALLGEESIAQSGTAAFYGIAAVVLFMLVVYRLPGIMANAALLVYMLILLGALAAINATLTLPGIAGIILSFGMAVDANVIIFERIREELRAGRTVRSAIDAGFKNALSAILDANITTLIATAVLYYLSTGPVKGFAVTLAIGVLSSMFSAIVITRFLLRHLVEIGWFRHPSRLFGVREVAGA